MLLKEIMTDCESFQSAQAVSVEYNRSNDSWELNVSWLPHPTETDCLKKIIDKHGLEMVTTDQRTIFRSTSKK